MKTRDLEFCRMYASLRSLPETAIRTDIPIKQAQKLLARKDIQEQINRISSEKKSRDIHDSVIAGLERLAFSHSGDSLKLLAFQDSPSPALTDGLDLFHVSEIKFPKGGGLEIKFFDRFKALQLLDEISRRTDAESSASSLFSALEKSAAALSQNATHTLNGKTENDA